MAEKNLTRLSTKSSSLRVEGSFKPDTYNKEDGTIEVVFTTGQSGLRFDYWNDVYYDESLRVDLDSVRPERLDKGLSVLDSHRRGSVVKGGVLGITEGWRIEDGAIFGTVRFSKNQKKVESDVADGIIRHVSLGYSVFEYLVTDKAGERQAREAIDWEPTELSFVPVSFETTNGTRSSRKPEDNINEVILTKREVEMTEEQRIAEEARIAKEKKDKADLEEKAKRAKTAPDPTSSADSDHKPVRAGGDLTEMLAASRAAGLEDGMATDAFIANTTVDDFRAAVLTAMADKQPDVKTHTGGLTEDQRKDEHESMILGAREYIAYRAGVDKVMSDGAREYVGMTMYDIAKDIFVRSGGSARGLSRMAVADRAMNSTSDMPLILENVMNKSMRKAYEETARTFEGLGHKTTVNDFREKNIYSMGDAPSLVPLGEGGEYRGASLSEGKESYKISTFARKIAFTRQMLINDDMSAIERTPKMFGGSASRLESNIVWGLLIGWDFFKNKASVHKMRDGNAIFHASHNNLATGAESEFSEDALSAMRKKGREAKTKDGNYMNIEWDTLALPTGLETPATKLLASFWNPTESANVNTFKMNLVVEPRLNAVSEKSWYGFSNMMDSFEYAYLAGEEGLYTEVKQSTDIDGITILARHDFGAGIIDERGMYKNAGA